MDIKIDKSSFPLKRDRIPIKTFEKLWDELRRVLNDEYNLSTTSNSPGSAKFFGMGEFAPPDTPKGMITVATVIGGHDNVRKFLDLFPKESQKINFGDYLYKRRLEASSGNNPEFVTFGKRAYVYGYFLFLGFQDRASFEAHHGLSISRDVASPDPQPAEQTRSTPTRYIGSFFSFRSYFVKHFVVTIYFDNQLKTNVFHAEEWGFHRMEDVHDLAEQNLTGNGEQKYRLKGTALIRNNKLYLNLATSDTENNWTQMNMIGWCYGSQPDQVKFQRVIRCNVQTVSVLGYPVAAEAVLVRIDDKKWEECRIPEYHVPTLPQVKQLLGEREANTLIMYLMMQRRNFWIRDEFVNSLLDLEVRGILIQNHLNLRGTWRVWNYGLKRGNVMQSKLVVNENFAANFYPYLKPDIFDNSPRLESQVATLAITSGGQPNKLFFYTYQKPNLSIVNSAVFDLDTIDKFGFAEGMFLSSGYDPKGIIGGYCVMKKLKPGEEDFSPMMFTWEEARAYEEKHHLNGLYEGLRDLWRRKTWPRRKTGEQAEQQPPA